MGSVYGKQCHMKRSGMQINTTIQRLYNSDRETDSDEVFHKETFAGDVFSDISVSPAVVNVVCCVSSFRDLFHCILELHQRVLDV